MLFFFFFFLTKPEINPILAEIILRGREKLKNEQQNLNNNKENFIENIDIKESFFQELKGAEKGGAIYVNNNQIYLKLSLSLFIGCSSTKNGGAVYVEATRFDIIQSMLLECYIVRALWSGQAFMSISHLFSCNESTVNYCPPSIGHSGSEAIIISGGIQNVRQLNTSHNIASSYASGLATSESVSFLLKYSMIYYNRSPNHILAFIHLRPDDDISFCNIIHNTVENDGLIFISGGYCVMRKCVFKKNSGTFSVFNNAYGPGFITIEECSVDVPRDNIIEGQTNLYDLGSTFTRKPSKHIIPHNIELQQEYLEKVNRYVNTK